MVPQHMYTQYQNVTVTKNNIDMYYLCFRCSDCQTHSHIQVSPYEASEIDHLELIFDNENFFPADYDCTQILCYDCHRKEEINAMHATKEQNDLEAAIERWVRW